MGNSVSKAKTLGVISIGRRKSDFPSSTTSSSERTLVEESTEKKKKPSILPNGSFFNNSRTRRTRESKPTNKKLAQNYHNASVRKTTVSRKKPRTKKKTNITKSIIGKPTNFKHLSSSTSFNGQETNANSDEEDIVFASQMIALATLIKPLPNSLPDKTPIIPPRTSSYGNEAYLKSYSIPLPPLHASPKSRKTKRSAATPSSIKKTKKNQVKYVSIGKTSMARKHIH